jgi:hypothetical protein
LRRIGEAANNWLASIISLVGAALFLLAGPAVGEVKSATDVNLACAGIIGAALALILSLSIIPAQKAAEAFSAAILRLYARDRTLQFVFALLSATAITSVLLGTGWTFGLTVTWAIAIQVVLLGLSFDGLRLFYKKTLALLIPATAIDLVMKECRKVTARVARGVDRGVRLLQAAGTSQDSQAVTTALFYAQSQIAQVLQGWIVQLNEFAHKAIARADTQAVNGIVTALQNIANQYADARRNSVVLVPDLSNLFAGGRSDISRVLEPVHENIRVICQHAAKEGNEIVVRHCILTMGAMTEYAMTIVHESNLGRQTPFAHSPSFYLNLCAQIAIKAGMEDAVLAAIGCLQTILLKPARDVDTSIVEANALESLSLIAASGYAKPDSVVAFPAVRAMLWAAHHDIELRGYRHLPTIQTVLNSIRFLVPFEIIMDKAQKRMMVTFPPYSLGFQANIPGLLGMVADRVKSPDPTRSWVNPFHEFLQMSEDVVHHYREVAEFDFQNALLMKWVIDSVILCAKVHIALLANPPVGSKGFTHTVDDRLRWFIYAPTFFFNQKAKFPSHHAHDACGALAVLGMVLLEREWLESAKACGIAIGHIAQSCAASQAPQYALADLHQKLEILARASDALGYEPLAAQYRALIAKPPAMAEALWAENMDQLSTRIDQLDEELEQYRRRPTLRDDPIDMLRDILARNPQPEPTE